MDAEKIYQIKIVLDHTKPPIWRRVLVPSDMTLDQVHDVIQCVMGWENYHLHHFHLPPPKHMRPTFIGPVSEGYMIEGTKEERDVTLADLLDVPKQKLKYEYDFGDGWLHTITLEKILAPEEGVRYPVCIGGVRACPPEDIGGVWGYMNLVGILANPTHERHAEMVEWVPPDWNPETFELGDANDRLLRVSLAARNKKSRR